MCITSLSTHQITRNPFLFKHLLRKDPFIADKGWDEGMRDRLVSLVSSSPGWGVPMPILAVNDTEQGWLLARGPLPQCPRALGHLGEAQKHPNPLCCSCSASNMVPDHFHVGKKLSNFCKYMKSMYCFNQKDRGKTGGYRQDRGLADQSLWPLGQYWGEYLVRDRRDTHTTW